MKKIEEGYDIIEKNLLINKIKKINREKINFIGKKGEFDLLYSLYYIFI
jgi:hypothetical protein